jgi:hypothetical protein
MTTINKTTPKPVFSNKLGDIQGAAAAHAPITTVGPLEATAYTHKGRKAMDAALLGAARHLEAPKDAQFRLSHDALGDGRIGWRLTGPVDREVTVRVNGNRLDINLDKGGPNGSPTFHLPVRPANLQGLRQAALSIGRLDHWSSLPPSKAFGQAIAQTRKDAAGHSNPPESLDAIVVPGISLDKKAKKVLVPMADLPGGSTRKQLQAELDALVKNDPNFTLLKAAYPGMTFEATQAF